jgi:hypothetical protein
VPWNYGERILKRGGDFGDREVTGIYSTLIYYNRLPGPNVGFRAYGERLIGRNSRSVTASGIFDIELNSRREVNTQERGFRASSELW